MKKLIMLILFTGYLYSIKPTADQQKFFDVVKNGQAHEVQQLIKKPTVDVNFPNEKGDSALHIAARKMFPLSEEIVNTLLHAGAKINAINRPYQNKTPLYVLIHNSDKWNTPSLLNSGLIVFNIFKKHDAQADPQNDFELLPIAVENYRYLQALMPEQASKYLPIIEYLLTLGYDPDFSVGNFKSARALALPRHERIEKIMLGPVPKNYILAPKRKEDNLTIEERIEINEKTNTQELIRIIFKNYPALPEVLSLFDRYSKKSPESGRRKIAQNT